MPYRVTFQLDAFNGTRDAQQSIADLSAMLRCLTEIDENYLRHYPNAPLLYQSGVRYEEEPIGAEFWQDIPTVLQHRVGDCLPLDTLVLREDEGCVLYATTLGSLKPGDRIVSEGDEMTTVLAVAATGLKPILAFQLENETEIRVSPNHRMILNDNREGRAEQIREGARLRTGRGIGGEDPIRVLSIKEWPSEICGDIQTESGRFLLAPSGVVVHNCEDLACWLVAEKRVRFGIPAQHIIYPQLRPNGRFLYHIAVATPDAPGGVDDPSRRLGMK